jgi:hypothetical protein
MASLDQRGFNYCPHAAESPFRLAVSNKTAPISMQNDVGIYIIIVTLELFNLSAYALNYTDLLGRSQLEQ